ncbi:MAG: uracil-DNA glycosylase [Mariprofundaceae bacterium]
MSFRVKLENAWKQRLLDEFSQSYMRSLHDFIRHEQQAGKTIYPDASQYFSAMNLTPFDSIKVVILGQDPYHGPEQAHGLCFSVPPRVSAPPSLLNIYKELSSDLALPKPKHGCLVSWATQGVLLLNSVLTVEKNRAASHQRQGWEQFTDQVIAWVNQYTEHTVFMLWGAYAQKKGAYIDTSKHLVLKAPHPSPLSAHRGFFGQKFFSRTNEYLCTVGKEPIQWALPDLEVATVQFQKTQAINQDIA